MLLSSSQLLTTIQLYINTPVTHIPSAMKYVSYQCPPHSTPLLNYLPLITTIPRITTSSRKLKFSSCYSYPLNASALFSFDMDCGGGAVTIAYLAKTIIQLTPPILIYQRLQFLPLCSNKHPKPFNLIHMRLPNPSTIPT